MNALTRLERIDDMFPEFFRRFMQPMTLNVEPLSEIRIDVDEREKEYLVRAEIPGARKDDIRVEIDGNRVSISAEVKKDYEEKKKGEKEGRVLLRETYRGAVSRSFTLAHDIDETSTSAKLEDGVLKLTLPKRQGERHRYGNADHAAGERPVGHVHGHALAQLDALEVFFVGAIGALRPAARVGVVVEHPRHAPLGEHAQILDAGNDLAHAALPRMSGL